MTELLLVMALAGAVDVKVSQRDGTEASGTLTELAANQLTVEANGQARSISTDDVRQIRLDTQGPADTPKDAIRVALRNGSKLTASQFRVEGDTATLKLISRPEEIELPTRVVDHAVLTPSNSNLDEKRDAILAVDRPADLVTVRRKNDNLEFYDGVLSDISDTTVRFQFEGDWIPIPRERIDAIRYYSSAGVVPLKSGCKLVTNDGSVWHAQQVSINGDDFMIDLSDELTITLPVKSVATIDFASSATVFLSDLQPEDVNLTPSIEIRSLTQDLADLGVEEPFLPRGDHSFGGRDQPLRLLQSDGRVERFAKGLAVHSRTELTYRLAGEYRELRALAGLDPSVRKAGSIIFSIRADDSELLRTEIRGGMSPIEIAVDVTGAKRLILLVDYGDASDVADRLNLCEARLIK